MPPMAALGFCMFDTALGPCGVAWSERGLVGVQLPERSEKAGRQKLQERFPTAVECAPSAGIARAIELLVALLRGEPEDLSQVALDMEGVSPFHRKVYERARRIPLGRTCSYGELAQAAGSPGAARAVGGAMSKNPWPLIVPCHRVVAKGGALGGFTAFGGVETKRRLMALECRLAS